MKIDAMSIKKEKLLSSLWEKLREIVCGLEEFLPDMAEELGWICENLEREIFQLREEKHRLLGEEGV